MEFTINHDCFQKAISDVSKAISLKTAMPILSGIKLTATNDGITLLGRNLDIIIEKRISPVENGSNVLDVQELGSVILPAKYLTEIIKKLPDDHDIHVKSNNRQFVSLTSDDIIVHLIGLDPIEYPGTPTIEHHNTLTIQNHELMELIQSTVFAVAKKQTSPVLTGIHISIRENQLTFAATNSHRLALQKLNINSTINRSCIVPSIALLELSKLMDSSTSSIEIIFTDHYILFQTNSITLYSRLIEGNYPNTSSLIPHDFKSVITMNTKQLLKGIERACLFAYERKNTIHLEMVTSSELVITSRLPEIGKIVERQRIESLQGEEEFQLSLDGSFITDALKAIKENEIRINFSGTMRPILIYPVGNHNHLHLISPVRS